MRDRERTGKLAVLVALSLFLLVSVLCGCSVNYETQTPEQKVGLFENLSEEENPAWEKYELLDYMDTETIQAYVNDRSPKEFLDALCAVYKSYKNNPNVNLGQEINPYKDAFESIVVSVENVEEIIVRSFGDYKEGDPGWYSTHPNADPQPYEEEVRGQFYSRSGENARWETKTNRGTVSYYGDFAVMNVLGYRYEEGKYEWVNGKFVDELPRWGSITDCIVYFCGEEIEGASSPDIAYENVSKYRVLIVGENLYQVRYSSGEISAIERLNVKDFKILTPEEKEEYEEKAQEEEYNKAVEYMKTGNYESAIKVLESIPEYKDSAEMLKECKAKMEEAQMIIMCLNFSRYTDRDRGSFLYFTQHKDDFHKLSDDEITALFSNSDWDARYGRVIYEEGEFNHWYTFFANGIFEQTTNGQIRQRSWKVESGSLVLAYGNDFANSDIYEVCDLGNGYYCLYEDEEPAIMIRKKE